MLKQRILTTTFLLPLALVGILYTSRALFATWLGVMVLLAAWEWVHLMRLTLNKRLTYLLVIASILFTLYHAPTSVLLGLCLLNSISWISGLRWIWHYPKYQQQWHTPYKMYGIGCLLLIPTWSALLTLKTIPEHGQYWVLYAMSLVWITDTTAYFTGKRWGRHKLAPKVSPGKSIEGVIGSVLCVLCISSCVGWILADTFNLFTFKQALYFVCLSLLTATTSIIGDLFESMIKRASGRKDSGTLLPGHGGVLDRIDGLTAALPIFTLLTFWGNLYAGIQ